MDWIFIDWSMSNDRFDFDLRTDGNQISDENIIESYP